MASCGDVFAEPMLDTKQYLKEYLEQIAKLDKQKLLPDLDAKLKYKVYSLRVSGFGGHKSIVLTTNDKQFVSVELGFTKIEGVKRIYPVTREIDKAYKPKMEYLGEIEATGVELIAKAIAVMKHFGKYFKLNNNCQNFCNMYTEAIGLKHAQTLTDGDKASIATFVGGIIVSLFAFLR